MSEDETKIKIKFYSGNLFLESGFLISKDGENKFQIFYYFYCFIVPKTQQHKTDFLLYINVNEMLYFLIIFAFLTAISFRNER